MSNMDEAIHLTTLAGGAIEEAFNTELAKVIQNIQDLNTDEKAKRKINLAVEFVPNKDREGVAVTFQFKTTLAPQEKVQTGLWIGTDGKGKAVAMEMLKQVPGQQFIQEADKETGELKIVSLR